MFQQLVFNYSYSYCYYHGNSSICVFFKLQPVTSLSFILLKPDEYILICCYTRQAKQQKLWEQEDKQRNEIKAGQDKCCFKVDEVLIQSIANHKQLLLVDIFNNKTEKPCLSCKSSTRRVFLLILLCKLRGQQW